MEFERTVSDMRRKIRRRFRKLRDPDITHSETDSEYNVLQLFVGYE